MIVKNGGKQKKTENTICKKRKRGCELLQVGRANASFAKKYDYG